MSIWHREEDGTYVTEMSDFGHNPTHPVAGDPIYLDNCIDPLRAHVVNEEILWYYGTLADGTRVLIYND